VALIRISGFLRPAECLAVRSAMDAGVVEEAEILGDGIRRQALVRNAALVEPAGHVVEQIEARLEACRERVAASLGMALGDREGAGFVRYPAGGFYRPHRDRGDDPQWKQAAHRAVALVLFLNSSRDGSPDGEFDGGALRLLLPDGDIDVTPEAGLLVAFPADALHEVTEVRGGTRDAIVDWFYSTGRGRVPVDR
jgi:predicted 2-oxoglutarate/Fe(II)-dependent dioxygenase YbiX